MTFQYDLKCTQMQELATTFAELMISVFALDTNHSAAANFGSTPNLNLSTIQPLPSPDAVEASPIIQLIPIAKATLE